MSHDDSGEQKKIHEKDLVFFSTETRKHILKNDYHFLVGEYEHLKELPDYDNDPKYRVWGLPFYSIFSPPSIGFIGGMSFGVFNNMVKKRPRFSNIHVHAISGLLIWATAHLTRQFLRTRAVQRELLVWDYVKRHPEDFPEVFNPPKKYKDILRQWYPVR